MPGFTTNLSEQEEESAKHSYWYDVLLYLTVPVQYACLIFFCFSLQEENLNLLDFSGRVLAMGILCGNLGINVAHELGHRVTKHERFMAKALLLTSQYMHFIIEHNRGHHKRVATDEDPASAKKGEMLYTFWVRSIVLSYASAWKIEREQLGKNGQATWSLHNEMLRFALMQVALLLTVGLVFGGKVLLGVGVAAMIGMLLLETINYIEHYGLRRSLGESGRYERVLPAHSWNSDHMLGRLMLFELSRHSDHHYKASRKYQILRHMEESPQLPTGYPGMMLLSTLPPLWFWVMHKRMRKMEGSGGALQKAVTAA